LFAEIQELRSTISEMREATKAPEAPELSSGEIVAKLDAAELPNASRERIANAYAPGVDVDKLIADEAELVAQIRDTLKAEQAEPQAPAPVETAEAPVQESAVQAAGAVKVSESSDTELKNALTKMGWICWPPTRSSRTRTTSPFRFRRAPCPVTPSWSASWSVSPRPPRARTTVPPVPSLRRSGAPFPRPPASTRRVTPLSPWSVPSPSRSTAARNCLRAQLSASASAPAPMAATSWSPERAMPGSATSSTTPVTGASSSGSATRPPRRTTNAPHHQEGGACGPPRRSQLGQPHGPSQAQGGAVHFGHAQPEIGRASCREGV